MRLLWLPEVLRAAGLDVTTVPGWESRGADTYGPVRGITCHATAGSPASTDAGEISVLLNGSETAPPPIAQLYLSRTGRWWVVASGLCFHNKIGWAGPNAGYGNDALLGIEAQHSNTAAEPWPDVQYRSYVAGVAALVAHRAPGWEVPLAHVAGHKEHQPYPPPPGTRSSKSDPTFDMGRFRADVARAMEGDTMDLEDVVWTAPADHPSRTPAGQRDIRDILAATDTRTALLTNGGYIKNLVDGLSAQLGRVEQVLATTAADVAAAVGRDPVDEEALAAMLWARLPEQDLDVIERVLRQGMDPEKLAALGARLTSG